MGDRLDFPPVDSYRCTYVTGRTPVKYTPRIFSPSERGVRPSREHANTMPSAPSRAPPARPLLHHQQWEVPSSATRPHTTAKKDAATGTLAARATQGRRESHTTGVSDGRSSRSVWDTTTRLSTGRSISCPGRPDTASKPPERRRWQPCGGAQGGAAGGRERAWSGGQSQRWSKTRSPRSLAKRSAEIYYTPY